jgi:hypothetical protein
MNVKRLDGALLNFWVAKSGGLKLQPESPKPGERYDPESGYWHPLNYHPATDWSQAGPIVSNDWFALEDILIEWFGDEWNHIRGLTQDPLKWFMRAYVASQFGDEVEDSFRAAVPTAPGFHLNSSVDSAGATQHA